MSLPDIAGISDALAAQEAQVPNLRPGCEKRIIWAAAPETQTDICVVYIHGFSATGEELRPLPDLVAQDLQANLFFTRLTGHGQDGAAMGRARLKDWQADTAEALQIAQTLGKEVLVIGCSTGCTLATLALAKGAGCKAIVHISPNFGLAMRPLQGLLDLPASRHWSKYIAGSEQSFAPDNPSHAAYWTLSYPTEAVHVMADTVRAARNADLARITTPALFCFNTADQVVSATETRRIIARWGGPTTTILLEQTPQDDPMGHIMAGDIKSPQQTAPLAQRVCEWYRGL